MKRKLFGLVQEPAKAEDSGRAVAGIDSATPLIQRQDHQRQDHQRQDHHPATALEHGGIGGGEMQETVEVTRKEPALHQQQDGAVAAKAAEHQRRSAAALKAWATIRSNKLARENATQTRVLPNESGALMATGPRPMEKQITPELSTESLDDPGGTLQEQVGEAEIKTAELKLPDPAVVGENEAKPKKKPPGITAKEGSTPLKRGAALQVMTYPRPATKAILVRAAREHGQSLSSFLVTAGLEKEANRQGRSVKELVPNELHEYV
jgi:hypothetical protein